MLKDLRCQLRRHQQTPSEVPASYKTRSDSWEITSIDPSHNCIATNIAQNNQKLSANLICQDNRWYNPPTTHVYCIRHMAQNFMRAIKDNNLRKKVVNAWYAQTQPSFQYYHNEIRLSNAYAMVWMDNIPLEKWTRAFDGGCR